MKSTLSVDNLWMERAIKLALKARGKTSPNPMVGAVIVHQKKIVAQGYHHFCGGDHAEIDALKKVNFKAQGMTMYVTLEPCHHFGRTPPCVDAIIRSGIKEVVIGMQDPNNKTNGQSIAKLKKAGVNVRVGLLSDELQQMNEVFMKYITQKMPFTVTKTAQTLDGKIATSSGESKWITSEKTRAFARKQRDDFDAILVGINTVLADDPMLSGEKKKNLKKIIVDSQLKLTLKAKLFEENKYNQVIIATTRLSLEKKLKQFESLGIVVIVCPQKKKKVDLIWLWKELAKREISSILVEGGAQMIGQCLEHDLVDKMHIYIAPKILGDEHALSAVVGRQVSKLSSAINLKNSTIKKIDTDFIIEGYVHRPR